jgi:hypothetical protein
MESEILFIIDYIINTNILIIFCFVLLIYLVLRYLYRNSIVSLYDPLHIAVIQFSFNSIFFLLPLGFKVGSSFYVFVWFIFLYLISASMVSVKGYYKGQFLLIGRNLELFLSFICLLIILLFLIDLITSGNIPFLTGYVSGNRYMIGRRFRFITWLWYCTIGITFILATLSDYKLIRLVNIISIIFFAITSLLSGSKAALLYIIIFFLTYTFLRKLKGVPLSKPFRYASISISVISIILTPLLLINLGIGTNTREVIYKILIRLFAGFDQLILYSLSGFDPKPQGLSLLQSYFGSYLKVLFNYYPKYNSAVEILFVEILGFPNAEAMLPNSNLSLSVLLSNGIMTGSCIMVLFGFLTFYMRKICLCRPGLRLFDIFMASQFVINPMYFFYDDVTAVSRLILILIIYCSFWIPYNALLIIKYNKLKIL